MKLDGILPVPNHHLIGSRQGSLIVLWTIRERGPLSFAKLYELVYGYQEYGPSQLNFISHALSELDAAGLIEFEGIKHPVELRPLGRSRAEVRPVAEIAGQVVFRTTRAVDAVQTLFNISITDYARGRVDQLAVDPLFGAPRSQRKKGWPDVFVLMPFSADLKPVYEDHIRRVADSLRIRCERADDFFTAASIIDEVWSAIFNAKVCIADCTGRNPNVFYELGIAHTLGRPCVLIAQSINDIPFDVLHRRAILYSFTPRGMADFESALSKTLANELGLTQGSQPR
jgi:hypothetical protein